MSGFQSPITINQCIDRIKRNDYLLPAFQREYTWKPEQIENLFDSLMKGYPISSMLFWKVRDEAKSSYRFYKVLDSYVEWHRIHNDAINTNQSNDFWALLDGQQRLTSSSLLRTSRCRRYTLPPTILPTSCPTTTLTGQN